jgi:hypothetical protein
MAFVGSAGKTRSELQTLFGITDSEAETFSNLAKTFVDAVQKATTKDVTFEVE